MFSNFSENMKSITLERDLNPDTEFGGINLSKYNKRVIRFNYKNLAMVFLFFFKCIMLQNIYVVFYNEQYVKLFI